MVDIRTKQARLDIVDNLVNLGLIKQSGGVALYVDKIRPQGVSISMSRQSGGIANWFNQFTVEKKKWVVQYKYPFKVYHVDDPNPPEPHSWGDDRYERRLEAEKLSLKYQINYIESGHHTEYNNLDKETVFEIIKRLKTKLENIEEEHPEWLI
jgi:hypothetical protein